MKEVMKNLITKYVNKETILYVIFGVVTTAVDFVVFSLLYYILDMNEVWSNNIAWFAAVTVAYITNKLIVFENKEYGGITLVKEIISFFLARVFSLIVTDAFLVFAKHVGMNMILAKVLISVVVIVMNYFFSKLFIFKKSEEKESGN